MRQLPIYQECFICGRNNPAGTGAAFFAEEDGHVICDYLTRQKHNGYKDVIHGGIITALLDECIGWAASIRAGGMCVTGELNVRFKRPLPVNMKIQISGFCPPDQPKGKRYIKGSGKITDVQGEVYAEASGTFFPLPESAQKDILKHLEYPDAPGKKVLPEDIWSNRNLVRGSEDA